MSATQFFDIPINDPRAPARIEIDAGVSFLEDLVLLPAEALRPARLFLSEAPDVMVQNSNQAWGRDFDQQVVPAILVAKFGENCGIRSWTA